MLKNFCKILKYSRMKKIRKGKLKNSLGHYHGSETLNSIGTLNVRASVVSFLHFLNLETLGILCLEKLAS